MTHQFAPLLCLTLLAACSVGPDYRAPDARSLPTHFMGESAATSAAAGRDDWWRDFGDPRLDSLVAAALRDSPDLHAAAARVRVARAEAGIAAANRAPTLQARARTSRDQLSRNGESFANMPIANPQTAFTDRLVGFDASWEIDLFGHNARALEAASARADSALEQQHDAVVLVAAETARLYFDYRSGQRRQLNLQRQIDAAEEDLHLTRRAQAAGIVGAGDSAAASATLDTARAALAPLEAATRASLASLAALLARDSRGLQDELGAADGSLALPTRVPAGLPSELLRRRPDIRRAERERAAASADIGTAEAARYPSFSLTGSAGFDSIHSGTLTDQASRFWSIGPTLTLPLFNAGRLQDRVDSSRAAFDAADATYRKAVFAALADTEGALVRYQQECGRRRDLAHAAAAGAEALWLAQRRFEAGEASRLDVLAASIAWRGQVDQQLASEGQCAANIIALHKALGGGWGAAADATERDGDLLTRRIP
ncbi:efflux transporter outer membrane subunit [Paludibacterium yongneupense]|uniref:efflux transporter outer membrane subunit n=1 Tax=Paludibacterium yongneupense TaxID=400061 RepID=UPI0003F9FF50|nr:efflux transporter outer membrane subunit [Paludibacterium yongneupense]